MRNNTGIDDPHEPPGSPDVEIDATDMPHERAVRCLLQALKDDPRLVGLVFRLPDPARFPALSAAAALWRSARGCFAGPESVRRARGSESAPALPVRPER